MLKYIIFYKNVTKNIIFKIFINNLNKKIMMLYKNNICILINIILSFSYIYIIYLIFFHLLLLLLVYFLNGSFPAYFALLPKYSSILNN